MRDMAFIQCLPGQLLSSNTSHFPYRAERKWQRCRGAVGVQSRKWVWRAKSELGDAVEADEKVGSKEASTSSFSNGVIDVSKIPKADSEDEKMATADEMRGHIISTLGWVGVTAAITPLLGATRGWDRALEFLTAYVVEYSLSVDNLFVFLLIFKYFSVPRDSQGRVLKWGIIGAMTLRGVMIVAGEALTQRFEFVTLIFAGILLFSAGKLLFGGDEDEEDLSQNGVVRFAQSIVDVADKFEGDRFFTVENGVRIATPLFLVLLCVELSDVVFALDSVPAVLGISDDVFVIYLSNILAIQGLRSLYFVLSDTIGDLRFLSQALAIVLGFVGMKMIAGVAGYEISVLPSLGVIVATLCAGVGASLAFPEAEKAT